MMNMIGAMISLPSLQDFITSVVIWSILSWLVPMLIVVIGVAIAASRKH